MHTFSVFAPWAERVELVTGGDRLPMAVDDEMPPERPGWWRLSVGDAGPGSDYMFSMDGGEPRPDPRSLFQPFGPHGPSRVIDHGAHGWKDDSWRGFGLEGAVLYELHVGTFTEAGTFEAAIGHLGHLVDLGVDAIELMPVAEASGERGWGYDGVDWYAPHHAYGGPEQMKRFVEAAHLSGLGVILDVVYNHLGPAGNYLSSFGPYFTDRYRTNWGDALNFDGPYSDEVRRFVVDNALMWLRDYHLDGLRLDAVHAISDRSARHLLAQLSEEVSAEAARLGRSLHLVAESDLNDPRFVRRAELGGYGLSSAWADEFHHALHAVLTGERDGYYEDFGSLAQLARALEQAWVYAGDWSPHRLRTHGADPAGLGPERFVVFLQNHDQVGNRARGDRIGQLTTLSRAKVGAALYLLSSFVALVFQGEEWMASSPFLYFTDHPDKELGRAVSKGRRSEFSAFGWRPEDVPDPQAESTFTASKLDWAEIPEEPHGEMLAWYRELVALRRALRAARPAGQQVTFSEEEGWLRLKREGVVVVANLGSDAVVLEEGDRRVVLSSDDKVSLQEGRLLVPPDSVAVLSDP